MLLAPGAEEGVASDERAELDSLAGDVTAAGRDWSVVICPVMCGQEGKDGAASGMKP